MRGRYYVRNEPAAFTCHQPTNLRSIPWCTTSTSKSGLSYAHCESAIGQALVELLAGLYLIDDRYPDILN